MDIYHAWLVAGVDRDRTSRCR